MKRGVPYAMVGVMTDVNPYQAPSAPLVNPASGVPAQKMDIKAMYTSFEGRIPRKAYWLYTLGLMIPGYVVIGALAAAIHEAFAILILAIIYPAIAVQVKRWHDRGKSGWWCLIALVPAVGGIWSFVEAGCLRGTVGANQYGNDPTGIY